MHARRTRPHTRRLTVFLITLSLPSSVWAAPSAKNIADKPEKERSVTPSTDPANPHVWRSRTTSVAVFKNGLGFFVREGSVALHDRWCLAGEVPPAAFGTLAIYSLDADEMVDTVGSGPGEIVEFDGQHEKADDDTKRNRLQAAVELRVDLTYKQHDARRQAVGKLVSVGPDFAVLDDGSNSFAVPIAGISRLQVLDLPLRIHVARDEENKADDARDENRKTRLGMAYLRKGITWIPEYTLNVLDETTAELTLRGTLVNEAEDLVHCDVNLVVGVPHFLHTDYLAPVAVGQAIRAIGSAVAPSQVQSQIMNRSAITSNAIASNQFLPEADLSAQQAAGNVAALLGNLPQIEAAGGSDFTVYRKNDLTLRRGEKAILTLFKRRVQYTHLYRWSPPEPIEHRLLLANDTPTAWTTGPCLAVSGGNPLSEDLLRYTPRGGKGDLPVTSAMNIAYDQREVEIERQLKAHSPADRVHLDLVTLEGTLKLRNFEAREVEIELSVPVAGKPTKASAEGSLAADPRQLKLTERAGTVRWTVKLAPGETKTFSYRYERYVPSN
ncbi:MAG TPA: hypothetical protein VG125_32440 [Pirellulales bacterium]|jgi:hypothetical protein|nr:hypothetical protein [Pirellulales bacterium]